MRRRPSCQGASCPLQNFPLFEGQSPELWQQFANTVVANNYKRNDILFYEGNIPQGIYFMCQGRLKLIKDNHSGKSQIVRIVEAPNLVGDRSFFSERPYASSGVIMEDATICFLSTRRFWSLFDSQTGLARRMAQRFARELGKAEEQMHCLAVCTVNGRLAAYLLKKTAPARPANNGNGGDFKINNRAHTATVELKESRTELAQILGTTVEAVSRALAELRRKGVIRVDGRKISIQDAERLGRIGCNNCAASWSWNNEVDKNQTLL